MRAPIDWLKEYVDISLSLTELAWKLTEIGLGVERVEKQAGNDILELEITPNRPDLLSITGIAREIAAVTGKSVKLPVSKLPPKKADLSITVNNDFNLFNRYTALIIDGISIGPSPDWLQKRLIQMNLRPINNIVDVTNYVMFEFGIPLHAFDYRQIKGHEINVLQSAGGEEFTSVDELTYKLPKDAIIIRDRERLIDLAGIKGGLNSGINKNTQTVYLHSTVDNPILIRKTAQALNLHSDASYIYERGVDPAGTLPGVARAASLILNTAGGKISSELIDLKKAEFKPRKLDLRLSRFEKISGIKLPADKIISIMKSLYLEPKLKDKDKIETSIPTFRADIKLEEDLIEEVARIYGYNSFPTALPQNPPPLTDIAYQVSYQKENQIKKLLIAGGLTEIYTYSLISEDDLDWLEINKRQAVKLENPVSLEFEYLRPTILINLIKAVKINQANYADTAFFELGRTYLKNSEYGERNMLSFVVSSGSYLKTKGIIELFLERLNIKDIKFRTYRNDKKDFPLVFDNMQTALISVKDQSLGIVGKIKNEKLDELGINGQVFAAEIDWDQLKKMVNYPKYRPITAFPPYKEDLTLVIPPGTLAGDIITEISASNSLVKEVEYLDSYRDTLTLRIIYQANDRNLTAKEISSLRRQIVGQLSIKYGITLKV